LPTGIQVDDHGLTCWSPGLFARTPGRGRVRRLDVISQGREPRRDPRRSLSLSKRWRVGIGVAAAVAAVLAVACVSLRHGTGAPGGAAASSARSAPSASSAPGGAAAVTDRLGTHNFFVCAPSTAHCYARINVISLTIP
jgi:hypothetical protein